MPALISQIEAYARNNLKNFGISYEKFELDPFQISLRGVNLSRPLKATARAVKVNILKSILQNGTSIVVEGLQANFETKNLESILALPQQNIVKEAEKIKNFPALADVSFRESKLNIKIPKSNLYLTIKSKNSLWEKSSHQLQADLDITTSTNKHIKNIYINSIYSNGTLQSIIRNGKDDSISDVQVISQASPRKGQFKVKAKIRNQEITNLLYELGLPKEVDLKSLALWAIIKRSNPDLISIKFRIGSPKVNLDSKHLSRNKINGIYLKMSGIAKYYIKSKLVTIKDGKLQIKSPNRESRKRDSITVGFEVPQTGFYKEITKVNFSLAPTSCDKIRAMTPKSFAPILKKFTLAGKFRIKGSISIDHLKPWDFTKDIDNDIDCSIASYDKSLEPEALVKGLARKEAYTSIHRISPFLKKIVVAFEDGSFWNHRGFVTSTIIASLRKNLKARKVVAGGSTISMQTAKNLFLTSERTLSRKLQELLLTWHLEQKLSKEKILEIYLNIIEYGPHIYGIKKAAMTFFNKSPIHLNLAESAYIASILPSPVKRFSNFCRGYLTNNYQTYLNKRLDYLAETNLIPPGERSLTDVSGITFAPSMNYPQCQSIARKASSLKYYQ